MFSLLYEAQVDSFIRSTRIYYGRAQQSDRTAEDRRKTEQSSAPYAEVYSPRSASTCLVLKWISFLTTKMTRGVNYQWGGSIAHGQSFAFANLPQAMH